VNRIAEQRGVSIPLPSGISGAGVALRVVEGGGSYVFARRRSGPIFPPDRNMVKRSLPERHQGKSFINCFG
jgi:hypothetical protein